MKRPRLLSVFLDMQKEYTPFEAWAYDRFGGPVVSGIAYGELRPIVAALPAGAHVLDVGCGGGQLLASLAEDFPALRFTGVDLSPGQVKRVVKRTEHARNVTGHVGSALELPLDDDSFDLVISMASVKHWPAPLKGIEEILRVTKPGGRFWIGELDRGCRNEDAVRFAKSWRLPAKIGVLGVPVFRTFVAGEGPDMDDARGWLQFLGLPAEGVYRIPNAPFLAMTGTKA